ncbi:MAG: hypothetical protein NW220_20770 [Leptolyngbyaceae cyanobacterium bins.349]|nr:hypothetical protein [Leptolyngbyaceae cyanobacterium bins.349]
MFFKSIPFSLAIAPSRYGDRCNPNYESDDRTFGVGTIALTLLSVSR